jgi:hypothetical protein
MIMKVYFTLHQKQQTHTKIMSRDLIAFQRFPIDVESYKCVFSWWHKEEHNFPAIILFAHHIFGILASQIKIERIFPLLES